MKHKRIAQAFSNALFRIGNSMNIANFMPYKHSHMTKTDNEVLAKDWEAVGRNMLLVFQRFERE